MLYQKQTFTLPAAPARITQTDWEIAVGLRTPDGKLVQPLTVDQLTVEDIRKAVRALKKVSVKPAKGQMIGWVWDIPKKK